MYDQQKQFAEKVVLFWACKLYNLEIASPFSDFRIMCKRAGDTSTLLTASPRNTGTASTVTQSYVNCQWCNLVKRLNVTTKVSQHAGGRGGDIQNSRYKLTQFFIQGNTWNTRSIPFNWSGLYFLTLSGRLLSTLSIPSNGNYETWNQGRSIGNSAVSLRTATPIVWWPHVVT